MCNEVIAGVVRVQGAALQPDGTELSQCAVQPPPIANLFDVVSAMSCLNCWRTSWISPSPTLSDALWCVTAMAWFCESSRNKQHFAQRNVNVVMRSCRDANLSMRAFFSQASSRTHRTCQTFSTERLSMVCSIYWAFLIVIG